MRCRVCESPNCKAYERLRVEGLSYHCLTVKARKLYGEKISGWKFKDHFENCKG